MMSGLFSEVSQGYDESQGGTLQIDAANWPNVLPNLR